MASGVRRVRGRNGLRARDAAHGHTAVVAAIFVWTVFEPEPSFEPEPAARRRAPFDSKLILARQARPKVRRIACPDKLPDLLRTFVLIEL